jgi:hypothetical protein
MRIRHGFVSNSSSCSFTISTKNLTPIQIKLLKNHIEVDKLLDLDCGCYGDMEYLNFAWHIIEEDGILTGDTNMDNFDMISFMNQIGVDPHKINYYHT